MMYDRLIDLLYVRWSVGLFARFSAMLMYRQFVGLSDRLLIRVV